MSGIVGKNTGRASGVVVAAEIADNAITLAKMAGGTDGNIISYDASGDPVAIATGNDGQVLTSTGAGSPPAFEAAAGGGNCILLESQNPSGAASVTVGAGVISSTYEAYLMVMRFKLSASGDLLYMTQKQGGAYETAGYRFACLGLDSAGAEQRVVASAGAQYTLGASTWLTNGGMVVLWMGDLSFDGSVQHSFSAQISYYHNSASNEVNIANFSGQNTTANEDVEEIKFTMSGGDTFTGVCNLYGFTVA